MIDILDDTPTVVEKYTTATDYAERQLSIFWTFGEVNVEKDIQDLLVNMTPAEKHGVITTLKLFSLYELAAGQDYWSGRFVQIFKRPEFQRMASVFAMFELAVHKPFYSEINRLLHLDNDAFYNSYVDDETLKSRIEFIGALVDDPDPLLSLAGFSMVEGAILYSSFAFLKHFQSDGKNKMTNLVRGIDYSLRDEHVHSEAGAWTFRELKHQSNLPQEQTALLESRIREIAEKFVEHEDRIVDMIFEKGSIEGITEIQMKNFTRSRINKCLEQLGYKKQYDIAYNPIAKWFYKGIQDYTFNDFFSGQGKEYHRNWSESDFEYADYVHSESEETI